MSKVNWPKARPTFAVSALAAALFVAFPSVHAEPEPITRDVHASGRDRVNLERGEDYVHLSATRGGKIRGSKVDVEGRAGTLVEATRGGQIDLNDTDISASRSWRHDHGKNSGPAVSAVGDDRRGYRHGETEISLKRGSVTTRNDRSPAVRASGRGAVIDANGTDLRTYGDDSDVAQATSGGTLRLRNVEIDSHGRDADGVSVRGRNSSASLYKVEIETRGTDANGATVRDQGRMNAQRSSISTRGTGAVGLDVEGHGSRASVADSRVTTTGRNADGVRVRDGADVDVERSRISTYGSGSDGVDASGRGTEVRLERSEVRTIGRDATGVEVDNQASAKIERSRISTYGSGSAGVDASGRGTEVRLDRSEVRTAGWDATGVEVDNQASAKIERSRITTYGNGSTGVDASGRGTEVRLERSEVRTTGRDATGVEVDRQASAKIERSRITTKGSDSVAVDASGRGTELRLERSEVGTAGRDATGVAIGDRATGRIARSRIETSGKGAAGVALTGDSSARIVDTRIETKGRQAAGIEVSDSRAFLRDTRIRTSGSESDGLVVEGDDALVLGRDVDVAVKGRESQAVSVKDGGTAILAQGSAAASGEDGTAVSVRGNDSLAVLTDSLFTATGRGGEALEVKSGGTLVLADSVAVGRQAGATVASSDSLLIADGSWIASAQTQGYGRGHGQSSETALRVSDGAGALLSDTRVESFGQGGTALDVSGEGSLVYADDAEIAASGRNGVGLKVRDGASVILNDTRVTGGSTGALVDSGGRALLLGGQVEAESDRGTALRVKGNDSSVIAVGTEFNADGREGVGVAASGGASALLAGATIGARDTGLSAQGRDTAVVGLNTTIQAGSQAVSHGRHSSGPATGVLASDGGTVALIGGTVSVEGRKGVAAKSDNGTLYLDRVKLEASGNDAHAVVVESSGRRGRHGHGQDEAEALIVRSKIATSGDRSDAVVTQGRDSTVLIERSKITTTGAASAGVSVQDGSQVLIDGSRVAVSGDGSAAARVGSTLGRRQHTASALGIVSSTLNASGENAAGILVENSGDVVILDSTIRSTGASLVSRLDAAGQRQNIVIGDGATLVKNNGTLLQVDRSGDAGDGVVNLDLQDGSVTKGNIIDSQQVALEGDGGTYVRLGAKATYDGLMLGVREVVTEGGNQGLRFDGGSTIGSVHIDNHAVTGGGTIDNRINVSGDVFVDNATFGGNWNIGGKLTSTNGGIIRPGNSVGVISANALDWQPGSVYEAEVNSAGESDLVQVTGSDAADISGTSLVVTPENGEGRFLLNHKYTVLTAAGGVQGEFVDATWDGTPYPLIAMKTLYSSDAVAVRMGVDKQAIYAYGFTPNQQAAALGAASVAGTNATATEAFFSGNPAPAFDQLSGEVHASVRSVLLDDMIATSTAMQDRMRANLGAQQMPGQPTAALDGTSAAALPRSSAFPLWVSFSAGESSLDGDGNAASTSYSSNRILVGGDAEVGGGWRLGAAAGAGSGNFNVKGRSSDGSVDNYTMALYGGRGWDMGVGKLKVLLGAGYTRHDIKTSRSVNLVDAQSLDASYDGSTWQVFGDVGYAMPLAENFSLEPYANVSWFKQRIDGFDESGGDAALTSSSTTAKLGTYTLGLRTAMVFPGKTNTVTLRGTLGWRHAFGDRDPSRSMSFIEGAGSSFSVVGAPIAQNMAVVGLGGEVGLGENFALGLNYDGQFGSGNTDNTGSLFLKVRF